MNEHASPNPAGRPPRLMFVAGEASGDNHTAALVRELKARRPDVELFGAGGPRMREAGVELLVDLTEHAVVGLVEVLKRYTAFKRIFRRLVAEAEQRRPDAVVLTDYPGFNLRFATQMKRRGLKVIYFISPQVWAWHSGRARQIERDVDLMLTIFPFEKGWYAARAPRLRVEFVGHPIMEWPRTEGERLRARNVGQRPEVRGQGPEVRGQGAEKLLLLLPGSREREVEKIFPLMAKVAERMPDDVKCVAAAVSERMARLMRHPRVSVQVGGTHELMRRAILAITASGTATMECAYFGCPMVVVYRVNWLTYLLGKALVKVKWLAMPNVIAGREIVPEFIQHRATPAAVANAAVELLADAEARDRMRRELDDVVCRLGPPGASARAAEAILRVVCSADG